MIDLDRRAEYPAAAIPDRLLAWTAPARAALGIDSALPDENGAQRQRRAGSMEEAFATEVELTRRSYAGEEVRT
jgi:hypothetical protein